MKILISVLIVLCQFTFNVYCQSVKYFRSYSEDKLNYSLKFTNSVDTSIVSKTECYRVTYDKTNRPIQVEKLRYGKPFGEIGELLTLKIEYKGLIENRTFCLLDMDKNCNCYTESIQRLNDKNKIIVRELDANGNPLNGEYSTILFTLNNQKNIIKKQYVNDELKPILFSDSSSHTIYSWSENKNLLIHTRTTYFGFKDKLKSEKLIKKVVETIDVKTNSVLKQSSSYFEGDVRLNKKKEFKYNSKGFMVYYYDSVNNGNIYVDKYEFKYNKYGNSTESLYKNHYSRYNSDSVIAHLEDVVYKEECDSLGLVTRITKLQSEIRTSKSDFPNDFREINPYRYRNAYRFKNDGCTSIEFKYDNNLQISAEFYYDNKNDLLRNGVCSEKYVYNNDNNIVEKSYWDANNDRVNNENGVAIMRSEYDGKQLKLIRLYDYKEKILQEILCE